MWHDGVGIEQTIKRLRLMLEIDLRLAIKKSLLQLVDEPLPSEGHLLCHFEGGPQDDTEGEAGVEI